MKPDHLSNGTTQARLGGSARARLCAPTAGAIGFARWLACAPLTLLLAGCLASQPARQPAEPQTKRVPADAGRPTAERTAPTPPAPQPSPTAGTSGVAGPPRFNLPDQVVLSFAKQPRDLPLRSLMLPGRNPQNLLKPQPTAADFQPAEVQTAGYFGPNDKYIQVPQAQLADCTYGSNVRVYFWYRVRPDLAPGLLERLTRSRPDLADVAVSQCPATLGGALDLALAGAFDQRFERVRAAERAQEAKSQSKHDEERNARSRWKDGATVMPPARVADLQRRIDTLLKQLEAATPALNERPASRNTPPAEALKSMVTRDLHPPLLELARSAWAQGQAVGAGEGGRTAFEAWDRGVAGFVMGSIGRLQRLWHDGWWSLDLVAAFEADLSRLYEAQLADKPLFDERTRLQVVHALSQRRSQSVPERYDVPEALAATPIGVKRIVFLTPGELVAQQIGKDIGRGMKDALQARAKAQQAVEDLDRNLKQSRGAFWSCWLRRCPELAGLYVEYSLWLKEKDWYQMTRYALEVVIEMYSSPKDPGMAQMLGAFMGLRTVDRGPHPSCQQAFDRWTAPVGTFVQTTLRRNPFDMAGIQSFSDRHIGGPEHRTYQSCRDAMEFVYRPRQP
jgi:hypothetical protein